MMHQPFKHLEKMLHCYIILTSIIILTSKDATLLTLSNTAKIWNIR